MLLQAKLNESRTLNLRSSWSWDERNRSLTQRVPIIKEIRLGGSQVSHVVEGKYIPSLYTGQLIKLDGRDMYVAHIEGANLPEVIVFKYTMSEKKPEEGPIWWSVEVAVT